MKENQITIIETALKTLRDEKHIEQKDFKEIMDKVTEKIKNPTKEKKLEAKTGKTKTKIAFPELKEVKQ